ncbi:uncharacterized protein LOC120648259 [Panicum virgatum]|uniref:uncharacterized protein LOC120648259 n=1 Tax=Panicum virgatum TaxID=38727 RepID=UPI0019D60FC8|nr:uncharacterized protein LOC120648259 [Panicum virgatum]
MRGICFFAVAAHWLLCVMAIVARSRKRKRVAIRKGITYAPIHGLSAANWDEDTCTITLDDEHYNNHIKDHKSDADFLNKPIQHFEEMNTIFGSTMATGKFAKESSAPLGTEDGGAEDCEAEETGKSDGDAIANEDNNGATSSANKTSKICKTNNSKKSNKNFNETHLSFYYAHLVSQPHIAKVFNSLPFDHKLNWVAKYIAENYSGQ